MKKNEPKQALNNKLNYFFNKYIRLLIIILLPFSSFNILFAQWEECNKGLGGNQIWCFINDNKNIYAGIDGGIFKTTDNGDSWISKNNGLKDRMDLEITSLALNGNNIISATPFDGIFLSTDKGEYWERKSNGLPYWLNEYDTLFLGGIFQVLLINNNNFYAGSDKGFYISTNNGNNWMIKNNGLLELDSIYDVNSILISGKNIFIGTFFGFFITTDNGESWFPKNYGLTSLKIYSLALKENNIFAGTNQGIFLTTNNGDNWEIIGLKNVVVDNLLIKGNNIIAGGYGIYLSTDNGKSWIEKNSGLTYLGITCLIINGDYIFAGTNEAGVFRAKLSDLGITDVKETEQKNKIKIFPNPASDEFKLKFHTPIETTVQLSVFDLLGNCVLSQYLQCTEGTNEKTINCEKLPHGYYYVKININENVETIPLVIIK